MCNPYVKTIILSTLQKPPEQDAHRVSKLPTVEASASEGRSLQKRQ